MITKRELEQIVAVKKSEQEQNFLFVKKAIISMTEDVLDNLIARSVVIGENKMLMNSAQVVEIVRAEVISELDIPTYINNPSAIIQDDIEWQAEIIGAMMNYAVDSKLHIVGSQARNGEYLLEAIIE